MLSAATEVFKNSLPWIGDHKLLQSNGGITNGIIWHKDLLKKVRSKPGKAILRGGVESELSQEWLRKYRSAGLTPIIENTLSRLSSLEVRIPHPGEIRNYLFRYYDLTDLLLPVSEDARQHFGPQVQLSLEIYRDPEIEDEYMALYVRQHEYDEFVMKKIKEIRAEYEEGLMGKTGWFLLTTDFHPPR